MPIPWPSTWSLVTLPPASQKELKASCYSFVTGLLHYTTLHYMYTLHVASPHNCTFLVFSNEVYRKPLCHGGVDTTTADTHRPNPGHPRPLPWPLPRSLLWPLSWPLSWPLPWPLHPSLHTGVRPLRLGFYPTLLIYTFTLSRSFPNALRHCSKNTIAL